MDRTKALSILDLQDDVDLSTIETIIAAKVSENEMRIARAANAILKEKYEAVGLDIQQAADFLRLELAQKGAVASTHSLPVAERHVQKDKQVEDVEELPQPVKVAEKEEEPGSQEPGAGNRNLLYAIGAVVLLVILVGGGLVFKKSLAKVYDEYRPATAKEEQQWQEETLGLFTKSKSKYSALVKIKDNSTLKLEKISLELKRMKSAKRNTPTEIRAVEKELASQKKYVALLGDSLLEQATILEWEGDLSVVRQLLSDKKFKDALAKVDKLYQEIDAVDQNISLLKDLSSQQLELEKLEGKVRGRFAAINGQSSQYDEVASLQSLAESLLAQGDIKRLSQEVYPKLISLYQAAIDELAQKSINEVQRYVSELKKQFVKIPAGTFKMGIIKAGATDARPVHAVSVAGFQLAKHPVTVEEYNKYLRFIGKPLLKNSKHKKPITEISWHDARKYAKWLSDISGSSFRLPTEAEWEYAARAGITTTYPWGNSIGRNQANCADCGSHWDNASPSPVGSFSANQWGLSDMNGNVWEWVQDCYSARYSKQHNTSTAVEFRGCEKRVVRGGCWNTPGKKLNPAFRAAGSPTLKNNTVGVRLALDEG